MKNIALLLASGTFTGAALWLSGCVSEKSATAAKLPSPKPDASAQDTGIIDLWHDYNKRQLTDLSLIVMPPPGTKRDAEGRPDIDTRGNFGGNRIFELGHNLRGDLTRSLTQTNNFGGSRISPLRPNLNNNFGGSRIAPLKDTLPKPADASDEITLHRQKLQDSFGKDIAGIALMFGAKMKPLTLESMAPIPWRDNYNSPVFRDSIADGETKAAFELAKKALETEKPQTGSTKLFRYQTRIVRLSEKACLNCHVGSRVGDPVAIMVYGLGDPKLIRDERNRLTTGKQVASIPRGPN